MALQISVNLCLKLMNARIFPRCYCDHQKYINQYSKKCICLQCEDEVDSNNIASSSSLSFLS